VVITNNVTDITQTTASTGGNVKGDGGDEITSRGVCWYTSDNPIVTSNKTSDGSGIG